MQKRFLSPKHLENHPLEKTVPRNAHAESKKRWADDATHTHHAKEDRPGLHSLRISLRCMT